jgi:hypothetical protein
LFFSKVLFVIGTQGLNCFVGGDGNVGAMLPLMRYIAMVSSKDNAISRNALSYRLVGKNIFDLALAHDLDCPHWVHPLETDFSRTELSWVSRPNGVKCARPPRSHTCVEAEENHIGSRDHIRIHHILPQISF